MILELFLLVFITILYATLLLVFILPFKSRKELSNKIDYLKSLTSIYKQSDDKIKNLLYLDALKEIELSKYQRLSEAYKNAKINIFSSDGNVVSDGFGAKEGASLGQFLKAVELVAGTSMEDLAKQVADKMKAQ